MDKIVEEVLGVTTNDLKTLSEEELDFRMKMFIRDFYSPTKVRRVSDNQKPGCCDRDV